LIPEAWESVKFHLVRWRRIKRRLATGRLFPAKIEVGAYWYGLIQGRGEKRFTVVKSCKGERRNGHFEQMSSPRNHLTNEALAWRNRILTVQEKMMYEGANEYFAP
jgi:hypothetical protein